MPITVNYFRRSGRQECAYDLSSSVGTSGANLPNDVKLIQTLFHAAYYAHPDAASPPPAGYDHIRVDGKFGPATYAHIRHFKELMRGAGRPTPPDGKIDPMPPGGPYSRTRHGYHPVITALNDFAANTCREAGQPNDFYLHLARRIGAFEVDESLRRDLIANQRTDRSQQPNGPIPL